MGSLPSTGPAGPLLAGLDLVRQEGRGPGGALLARPDADV